MIRSIKLNLLFILILFPAVISTAGANDLTVPTVIDFGDCFTGTSTYSAVYMKEFQIINTSNNIIYLNDISISYEYPSYIYERGNYLSLFDGIFKYFSSERILLPGDTAGFSIWYYSKFSDTISKISYLQAKLVYTYHYENDLTEYNDSSSVHMRSLEKGIIFTTGENYVTWDYCENITKDYNWDLFVSIFNKSNSIFIIDSINYIMKGNFNIKGLNDIDPMHDNGYRTLPYELNPDTVVYLVANIAFPDYSLNKLIFTIFCRNKNTNEQKILKDSSILNVTEPQPAILHNGSSYIVSYLGDSTLNSRCIWVEPCSGDSLVVDSLKIDGDIGSNKLSIIPYNCVFPRWLNPDSTINIASVEFIAREEGYKYGNIIGFFHDRTGQQYIRYCPFEIYVYPYSAVPDINSEKEDFVIYPNPANDFINININSNNLPDMNLIRIYNSLGEIILEINMRGGISKIPLNNLSNGLYFIVINDNRDYKCKSFIILK